MGEQINKEFEIFQKHLKNTEKKQKTKINFQNDKNLEEIIKELKNKTVEL